MLLPPLSYRVLVINFLTGSRWVNTQLWKPSSHGYQRRCLLLAGRDVRGLQQCAWKWKKFSSLVWGIQRETRHNRRVKAGQRSAAAHSQGKNMSKKADSSLRKMLLPPPQGSVQADAYSSWFLCFNYFFSLVEEQLKKKIFQNAHCVFTWWNSGSRRGAALFPLE